MTTVIGRPRLVVSRRKIRYAVATACVLLYAGLFGQFGGSNGIESSADNSSSSIFQILFASTYVVGVYWLYCKWDKVKTILPIIIPLGALCLLALCSTLWSADPSLTIRRSITTLLALLFAVGLSVRFSAREVLKIMTIASIIAVLVSLALIIFLPNYGIDITPNEGLWRGAFATKNVLARFCVLTIILQTISIRYSRNKLLGLLIIAASALLLMKSASTTGILSVVLLLALVAIVPLYTYSSRLFFIATSLSIGLVSSIILFYSRLDDVSMLFANFGKDLTFTGRSSLWQECIQMLKQNLILGYGYSAFWEGTDAPAIQVWSYVGWQAPHSHNGFLDLALDLGILGLVLLLSAYLSLLHKSLKLLQKSRIGTYGFVYCVFLLLYNLTESTLYRNNSVFFMIFVLLDVYVWEKYKGATKE